MTEIKTTIDKNSIHPEFLEVCVFIVCFSSYLLNVGSVGKFDSI